jgi:hypothetical protein
VKQFASTLLSLGLLSACLHAQTLVGTWTLYPAQAQANQVKINPPINADGSSVWSTKSTVAVQYDLQQSLGPVTFSSYNSPSTSSYLDFTFSGSVYLSDIQNLSAVYQFLSGNCYGGSLRWTFNLADGSTVYAYYGTVDPATEFTDCTSPGTSGPNNTPINQSGMNLLSTTLQQDARYELQGSGSPVYVNWATILSEKPNAIVKSVTLVLDSGWHADQVLAAGYPMNITVTTSNGNSATFVPASSTSVATCPTQSANIQVSKLGSGGQYSIDESVDSTTPDQGTNFRMVGCKYIYNLSGKSLGAGQYKVDVLINGSVLSQPAPGTLFVLK